MGYFISGHFLRKKSQTIGTGTDQKCYKIIGFDFFDGDGFCGFSERNRIRCQRGKRHGFIGWYFGGKGGNACFIINKQFDVFLIREDKTRDFRGVRYMGKRCLQQKSGQRNEQRTYFLYHGVFEHLYFC